MHHSARIRNLVSLFELMCNIVCVQYRGFGHFSQPIVAVGEDERQGPHQNPEVSIECPDSAYRLRAVEIHSERPVIFADYSGIGQKGFERSAYCHRSRARASTAMR